MGDHAGGGGRTWREPIAIIPKINKRTLTDVFNECCPDISGAVHRNQSRQAALVDKRNATGFADLIFADIWSILTAFIGNNNKFHNQVEGQWVTFGKFRNFLEFLNIWNLRY